MSYYFAYLILKQKELYEFVMSQDFSWKFLEIMKSKLSGRWNKKGRERTAFSTFGISDLAAVWDYLKLLKELITSELLRMMKQFAGA